jgi:hypothetical protein
MPSIRTQTILGHVLSLTASGAETQTLDADYPTEFEDSWPPDDNRSATALVEIRNTSGGTCTLGLYAPNDLAGATPYRVLDPTSALTAGELPSRVFGPFTRATLGALELRFSAAGTAEVGFQIVTEEGGAT